METAIRDHLKSSPSDEDQMDLMMMMMMQLPEFSSSNGGADATVEGFPPPEFSSAANRTMPLSDLINDSTPMMPWSSSFTDQLPSNSATISFSNNTATAIQPALFPNSGKGSWRGGAADGAIPYGAASSAEKRSSMAAMREMIFRIAAMQPIHIDPESVKPPKRRNVKISKDPQSVAARHRRERISERIRILQRLVPGGTKMDTASMLDEAIHYVKFLKSQVQSLERAAASNGGAGMGFPVAMSSRSATAAALPLPRRYQ